MSTSLSHVSSDLPQKRTGSVALSPSTRSRSPAAAGGHISNSHRHHSDFIREAGTQSTGFRRDSTGFSSSPEAVKRDRFCESVWELKTQHGHSAHCRNTVRPQLVRISAKPGYVLATAIPGECLNRVAWTRTWIPGERAGMHVERCFANLGMLLARLHNDGRVTTDSPDATTTPYQTLRIMLAKIDRPDSIVDTIHAWCETHPSHDERVDFVHGNLRMDNILAVGTRLAFIDFENCGRGSVYQDLSRPVSELLLTRSLWAFPHRRATRFLSAFLDSYASHHAYDPTLLWDCVGARVARYYLENRTRTVLPAMIGGVPVRMANLRELTSALMSNRLHQVMPEFNC